MGGPGEDTLLGASGNGTMEKSDKESDEVSCGDQAEDAVYLSGNEHSGHNIDGTCENVISY